ncbi:MAG TPA: hypothetical protein VEZ11_09305 [Thermoanaerobaculia bacterium]|nr:hypothetical protein [Thermoanaerobaculia bacterium]
MLLLKIFAPQLAALVVYVLVRLIARHRDPGLAQFAAIVVCAILAAFLAWSLPITRRLAIFALETFVALLAQLLILAAEID